MNMMKLFQFEIPANLLIEIIVNDEYFTKIIFFADNYYINNELIILVLDHAIFCDIHETILYFEYEILLCSEIYESVKLHNLKDNWFVELINKRSEWG